MPTSLGSVVSAPAISHDIVIASPTAGRDVFVAVTAAAQLSDATSPWTRIGYEIETTAGAVYRLPGASNTGAQLTLTVSLNGPRQLAAVMWEDQVGSSVTVAAHTQAGSTTSNTITGGPYTASAPVAVLVTCTSNGSGDSTLPQDVTGYDQGFVALDASTPTAATDEDSATYAASAADIDLSEESVTATFFSVWSHASCTFLLTYSTDTSPTGSISGGALSLTGAGTVEVIGSGSIPGGALSLTGTVVDDTIPGTAVVAVKYALLSRLAARAEDESGSLWGWVVRPRMPSQRDDLRGPTGDLRSIYVTESDGTMDVVVLTAGQLRFDETARLTLQIEAIGRDSGDDQEVVDRAAGLAVRTVAAEIATQSTWSDRATLGLDDFDYLWFTLSGVDMISTRVQGERGAGAGFALAVDVQARHSYSYGS